jgi:hypothetical protein
MAIRLLKSMLLTFVLWLLLCGLGFVVYTFGGGGDSVPEIIPLEWWVGPLAVAVDIVGAVGFIGILVFWILGLMKLWSAPSAVPFRKQDRISAKIILTKDT